MATTAGKGGGAGKARAVEAPTATVARTEDIPTTATDDEGPSPPVAMEVDAVGTQNGAQQLPMAEVSLECDEQTDQIDRQDAENANPLTLLSGQAGNQRIGDAASSSVALQAARLLAHQQAEYQRSVELVRQQIAQRHLQQMHQHHHQQQQAYHAQQQMHQAAAAAAAGAGAGAAGGGGNVMQHIHQRLQERIQLKHHQQLHADQLRHHQQQQQQQQDGMSSLQLQQQQQQYHAMMREIEFQAAASSSSTMAMAMPLEPVPITQEEIDRVRQERLHRLHQIQLQKLHHQQQQQQQQQHSQAAADHALRVTLTGVPPVSSSSLSADQLTAQQQRIHLLKIEQERLRVFQQQQQQAAAAKPPAPPSKVAQKKKRAAEATSSTSSTTTKQAAPAAATSTPCSSPSPAGSAASAAPAKKKRKTQAESQMETLVRVLCRLHLSRNESEMRTQLDKLAIWTGKTVDLCLLKFAKRDFVEIFGVKQNQFDKSVLWANELLPKYTFIHDKLRHTIAALDTSAVSSSFMKAQPTAAAATTASSSTPAEVMMATAQSDEPAKPVDPSSQEPSAANEPPAVATVAEAPAAAPAQPSSATSTGYNGTSGELAAQGSAASITLAAREHAYAALKEQMMTSMLQPRQPKTSTASPVVTATTAAATATAGAVAGTLTESKATNPTEKDGKPPKKKSKKKKELLIDVHAGNPLLPAVSTANTNTGSGKPTARVAGAAGAAAVPMPTPLISPSVAQQLFELDLAPRSCVVGQDEGEERFYFPSKPISNVMRKALPGGFTGRVRRRRKRKQRGGEQEETKEEQSVPGGGGGRAEDEDEEEEDDEEDKGGEEDGEEEQEEQRDDVEDQKHVGSTTVGSATGTGDPPVGSSGITTTGGANSSSEPPVKIDDAAVTFMQECVSEFLLFFTSEARDLSLLDKKKGSITGSNVVHAMENMGFSAYAKVLGCYNDKVRKMQDSQAQQKQERKVLAKQKKIQQEGAKRAAASAAEAGLQVKKELLAAVVDVAAESAVAQTLTSTGVGSSAAVANGNGNAHEEAASTLLTELGATAAIAK